MVTYAFVNAQGQPLRRSGMRLVFEVPDGTPLPEGAVVWNESAPRVLSAEELDAIADAAEADQLKAIISVFANRTATNAQVQRAIAYLLKKTA